MTTPTCPDNHDGICIYAADVCCDSYCRAEHVRMGFNPSRTVPPKEDDAA